MSARSTTIQALGLIIAAALSVALPAHTVSALDVPPLRGRVNDTAGLLSKGVVSQLELVLKEFEQKDFTQIVVLTVPSLEGDGLEEFSLRVAEQWKIGQKGLDNGAIFLISRADRQVRIEVGYGLEGRLTDLTAGRIIRELVLPEFRAGRFDQGVLSGVQAMIDSVRGEFQAGDRKGPGGLDPVMLNDAIPFLVLFIFLVFSLGRVSRVLGTAAGGFLMPFLGHMAFSPGMGMLLALAGIGLAAGFLITLMAALAPAGKNWSGGRPPGGWGGGFSTGGGDSRAAADFPGAVAASEAAAPPGAGRQESRWKSGWSDSFPRRTGRKSRPASARWKAVRAAK